MAEDDPLAKWRRPGQQPIPAPLKKPAETTTAKKAPVEYKAFGEAPSPPRVWLKCGSLNADQAPAYGYLTNITTDTWSGIGLMFSLPFPGPLVIDIRGEYLGTLAEAFIKGSVAWVQVFDPSKHIEPPDGTPVVRDIAIHDKPPENNTKH